MNAPIFSSLRAIDHIAAHEIMGVVLQNYASLSYIQYPSFVAHVDRLYHPVFEMCKTGILYILHSE